MKEYDYEEYAILYNVKQPNDVTVITDAFKNCDGQNVPIVYNMYQNGGTHIPNTSPDNVLGIARLENRENGVYARCIFFDKQLVQAIKGLTIYAIHCDICEHEAHSGIISAVKVISK